MVELYTLLDWFDVINNNTHAFTEIFPRKILNEQRYVETLDIRKITLASG